jgi:hypothetical protein
MIDLVDIRKAFSAAKLVEFSVTQGANPKIVIRNSAMFNSPGASGKRRSFMKKYCKATIS